MVDEEMRSALIRRRSKTPVSNGGLTTKEGIIAGLVAGKQLDSILEEDEAYQRSLQVLLLRLLLTQSGLYRLLKLHMLQTLRLRQTRSRILSHRPCEWLQA